MNTYLYIIIFTHIDTCIADKCIIGTNRMARSKCTWEVELLENYVYKKKSVHKTFEKWF